MKIETEGCLLEFMRVHALHIIWLGHFNLLNVEELLSDFKVV